MNCPNTNCKYFYNKHGKNGKIINSYCSFNRFHKPPIEEGLLNHGRLVSVYKLKKCPL